MSEASATGSAQHDASVAIRNGIRLALSLTATWAVAIVLRLQLPRHLGPEQFGQFNFCDALTATVFSFLSFGAGTYIMKEVALRPAHASDFFGGLVLVRTVLGLLAIALTALFMVETGRSPALIPVVIMFGGVCLVTGVNSVLSNVLQAATKVRALASINVIAKLFWGGGLILAIWFDAPLYAFALPNLVAELLKLVVLVSAARAAVRLRLTVDLRATWAMIIASFPYFAHGIAVEVGTRIDVTLLEMLRPGPEVGWYSAANSFAGLSLLLSPAIGWVIMPLLARAHERSLDEFYEILRVSMRAILLIAVPAALAIALGADLWVSLAFGSQFGPAETAIQVLAPMFLATYAAMLFSVALVILKYSWKLTAISFLSLALEVVLIPVCLHSTESATPGSAATGAALGLMLSELLTAAILATVIGRRTIDKPLVSAALKSAALAALVFVLDRLLIGYGPVRLVPELVVYLIGAFLVRAVTLEEVRALMRLARGRRPG